jgi:hypothetical protein
MDDYHPYAAANAAIFRKYAGRFLVRAGKFEGVEGKIAPATSSSSSPIMRRRLPAIGRLNIRRTSKCGSRTRPSI